MKPLIRPIAFYLPQYHQIPENDKWWGEGFTEWTNVRKAEPRFPGHYQPHVPSQLGYYDLTSADTRKAQADLARENGIHGFCYYHYWFNGKRLLESPFNEVLRSGEPDFPFCICWANENWTRRWDGQEREVLMQQNYNHEDDLDLIKSLFPAFEDQRHIRVNGKPLFIVYRTHLLPDPKRTTEIWREAMHDAGLGEIYLARVENHHNAAEPDPATIGFDAAIEFAPYWESMGPNISSEVKISEEYTASNPQIYDYDQCMMNMLGRKKTDYKLFRGAFPSWDNSARRRNEPVLLINSSPEKFAFWLTQIIRYTLENYDDDERLIFINAWNEWGEGCHLEPDNQYGTRHLEATRVAITQATDFYNLTQDTRSLGIDREFPFDQWYQKISKSYKENNQYPNIHDEALKFFSNYLLFQKPEINTEILEQRIRDLHNSLSWRITAPLRAAYDRIFK